MKSLLIALFALSAIVRAQELRVFFFNRNQEGASFRLQCLSSEQANRCATGAFRSKGKSLCKDADMNFEGMRPFNCVEDLEGGGSLCKYSDGTCAVSAKSKPVSDEKPGEKTNEEAGSKSKEESPARTIPSAQDLPSTDSLPAADKLPQADSLEPLSGSENLPDASELGKKEDQNK